LFFFFVPLIFQNWYYVGGKQESLEKVWKEFYVSPIRSRASDTKSALASKFAEKYNVVHTAPVFVMDPNGIARVVHTRIEKQQDLAEDINTIMHQFK
jgi:cytochrome oxidase Cu insertion factor (SCO1/SenC/PrrC family)